MPLARPQTLPVLSASPIFSEETERAVLGGVLLDPSAMADLADLTVDDFHVQRHKALWRAYLALRQDRTPIDLRTVEDQLVRAGEWEGVGGVAYLASLDLDLPDLGRLVHYGAILKDKTARRKLQAAGLRMVKEAVTHQGHASELFSRVETWLRKEDVKANGSLGKSIGQVGKDEKLRPPFEMRTITGIQRIDRLTAGLQRKTVTVIAGRPGMGKSALAVSLARVNAKLGYKPAYFSLEDGEGVIYRRALAQESGVSFTLMRDHALDPQAYPLAPEQEMSIRASERVLAGLPWTVEDCGPRKPEAIVAWVLRKAAADGVDLFILDHIHQISDDRSVLADMMHGCRFLANTLSIPVVVLAQFSRENTRRAFQKEGESRIEALKPQLSDLRECGAIEQVADLALLLFREHVYNEEADPRRAEALIAKHKNGQAPLTVPLDWDGPTMLFRSG